mmetsp:Transcript_61206/g.70132  ORF Transcript_61206/g.70132 Transcript_61206/m.70132 type:complete len:85 (-) Transcript_61206:476-730(-)
MNFFSSRKEEEELKLLFAKILFLYIVPSWCVSFAMAGWVSYHEIFETLISFFQCSRKLSSTGRQASSLGLQKSLRLNNKKLAPA